MIWGEEADCSTWTPTADFAEAVKWWHKLAEQGDEGAQLLLGQFYERGTGVERDYAEAYFWYSLDANLGDKDAIWLRDNVGKNLNADQKAAVDKRVNAHYSRSN